MTAVIALRPDDDRGQEILNALQQRTEMSPQQVLEDGTRRYRLDWPDAKVDAFDSTLDEIDPDWRNHFTNWRD